MNRTLVATSFLRDRQSPGSMKTRYRGMLALLMAAALGAGLSAQGTPPKPAAAAAAPKAAATSGVDTVIALVKGGMSEALVIRTLKRENKTYTLSPADLLKLQKAGVRRVWGVVVDSLDGFTDSLRRLKRIDWSTRASA